MGGRAVDCARLESVCSLTGTQGSNPCPSDFRPPNLINKDSARNAVGLKTEGHVTGLCNRRVALRGGL
jgi:hypothetical protein